jgi:hypothetical protein
MAHLIAQLRIACGSEQDFIEQGVWVLPNACKSLLTDVKECLQQCGLLSTFALCVQSVNDLPRACYSA